MRRCLEGLEPQRRAGLVLAYTHGLSHGEIAARLAVPLGTAKSWIRRAFMTLRECMG
ncbi:sigma factor-like helix-turn-helix DNA-binding protein [Methylobrevis pamukkalensis]|uniref:sigma factor-like helix-turn-helix DNA-binding protein n=1 Tax=Methylobrevis pamukkalensis TaxID=1439726 RepID=UPI00315A7A69